MSHLPRPRPGASRARRRRTDRRMSHDRSPLGQIRPGRRRRTARSTANWQSLSRPSPSGCPRPRTSGSETRESRRCRAAWRRYRVLISGRVVILLPPLHSRSATSPMLTPFRSSARSRTLLRSIRIAALARAAQPASSTRRSGTGQSPSARFSCRATTSKRAAPVVNQYHTDLAAIAGSIVPGVFRTVTPCFNASPLRGRTCASVFGGSSIEIDSCPR